MLVVEYDDFLLRALPIVGKDAAVDVLLVEEILHLRFVLQIVATAQAGVEQRQYHFVPQEAVMYFAANSKHLVDEFVQLKAAKIALCAKNPALAVTFSIFVCTFAAMSE